VLLGTRCCGVLEAWWDIVGGLSDCRISFFSQAAIVDIIFSFSLSLFLFGLACVEAPKVVSVGCYIKIARRKPVSRSFSLEPKLTKKNTMFELWHNC
jgi:hypothetical protein